MDYDVIILKDRETAEFLNEGLDDDTKVAFEDATGRFFTYTTTDLSTLNPSNFSPIQISQSVVDGTLPVLKRRKMFV